LVFVIIPVVIVLVVGIVDSNLNAVVIGAGEAIIATGAARTAASKSELT
jgi:hypothetical protein